MSKTSTSTDLSQKKEISSKKPKKEKGSKNSKIKKGKGSKSVKKEKGSKSAKSAKSTKNKKQETKPKRGPKKGPLPAVAKVAEPVAKVAEPVAKVAKVAGPDPVAKVAGPVKRPRTRINLETYLDKIGQAVKKCDVEIEKLSSHPSGERKGIKTLKSVRRILLDLETKAPKLTKLRRRYKMTGAVRKNSGLTTPQNISAELRDFLRIEEGRNLSRIEVTRAINSYIHTKKDETRPHILEWAYLNQNHRNLQNQKDKRIIFPDPPLAKLLRYNQYKKDVAASKITESYKNKQTGLKEIRLVTSNELHYRTVQKLIQVHYLDKKDTVF